MPKETIASEQHTSDSEVRQLQLKWGAEASYVQMGMSGDQDTGTWITLNRAQINAAIRYLRRARDAAYGRDE